MNTLIPLEYYYTFYIDFCLILVVFTLFHTLILNIEDSKNVTFINVAGWVLLTFILLLIGQRPISGIFGDTVNYNTGFIMYQQGAEIQEVNDYGWHVLMKFMASFTNIHMFFTLIAFIYIFPMYKISVKFFKEYWYYAFIMFVISFSFWTYGVNGIRNGAACSLFLWGVAYHDRKLLMAFFFLLATLFHKTMYLPILAFIMTYIYNDPKVYFRAWLACIPLSLVLGGAFITLFSSLGFADDRLSGYLVSDSYDDSFSSTGFRWDFLFHSAFAVFSGWYFIFKRKFNDPLYFQLFNTYLICNGFWILVIQASFSNRFAYLSWFMMAIVIIYPFLKERFFKDQHFMIGKTVVAYFSFTYLMFFIYYN